jgi:hypothetical protein
LTHAAVLALHTLCCGLPAAAMLLAALAGTSLTLLPGFMGEFHAFLHGHEIWILALSAALVGVGGWFEFQARRTGHNHGFPWMFAFSAACFVANVLIIATHRV